MLLKRLLKLSSFLLAVSIPLELLHCLPSFTININACIWEHCIFDQTQYWLKADGSRYWGSVRKHTGEVVTIRKDINKEQDAKQFLVI